MRVARIEWAVAVAGVGVIVGSHGTVDGHQE
jgi:hypothetical protein